MCLTLIPRSCYQQMTMTSTSEHTIRRLFLLRSVLPVAVQGSIFALISTMTGANLAA